MTEINIKCLKIYWLKKKKSNWLFTQRSRDVELGATENKSSEW